MRKCPKNATAIVARVKYQPAFLIALILAVNRGVPYGDGSASVFATYQLWAG